MCNAPNIIFILHNVSCTKIPIKIATVITVKIVDIMIPIGFFE